MMMSHLIYLIQLYMFALPLNGFVYPMKMLKLNKIYRKIDNKLFVNPSDKFIESNVQEVLKEFYENSYNLPSLEYVPYDTYRYNDKDSIVILLDLSVRSFEDLTAISLPFMERFVSKLKANNQLLSGDKFLYTHDIGWNEVCKISVARIPLAMYQKLDLGRKLSEAHSSGTVHVLVLSQYGEIIFDKKMMDGVIAGIQANRYTLPNFKKLSTVRTSNKSNNKISNSNSNSSNKLNNVIIIGPSDSQEDPYNYLDNNNYSNTNSNREKLKQEMLAYLNEKMIVNKYTNLARTLSILPPNILTPVYYTELIKSLAITYGWSMDIWTAETLRDEGCGAFYAVCQGNPKLPTGNTGDVLIRLKWNNNNNNIDNDPQNNIEANESGPLKFIQTGVTLGSLYQKETSKEEGGPAPPPSKSAADQRPVVLVGKGVCYDTGGLNLKPAEHMRFMKADMAGSAAALGTFMAPTTSNFSYPVECWLALVENNIGPLSFRQDDVVTAVTGDTIEIVHTDAEGRMILSDVLALASRKVNKPIIHGAAVFGGGSSSFSPRLLVDYATLTGTCIKSLTDRYIGAFTNRPQYIPSIIAAGEDCGERVWPFPVDEDFDEDLVSDVADVLQCRIAVDGDHIYATSFLKRFVNPLVPWVHLDLGSAHRVGGLGHVPSDFTGSGVRSSIEIISKLCP